MSAEDLNSNTRRELDALPRERDPGRMLEERTVRALRRRGVLRPRSQPARWTPWAAAAAVMLFLSGMAVGQIIATRSVTTAVLAAQDQTAQQTAAAVQRAGSDYVRALAALASLPDSASGPAVSQGREAALSALYAAAGELARLAPADPVAATIIEAIEAANRSAVDDNTTRSVVWF